MYSIACALFVTSRKYGELMFTRTRLSTVLDKVQFERRSHSRSSRSEWMNGGKRVEPMKRKLQNEWKDKKVIGGCYALSRDSGLVVATCRVHYNDLAVTSSLGVCMKQTFFFVVCTMGRGNVTAVFCCTTEPRCLGTTRKYGETPLLKRDQPMTTSVRTRSYCKDNRNHNHNHKTKAQSVARLNEIPYSTVNRDAKLYHYSIHEIETKMCPI